MPFPPLVEPVDALSDAERARTARHRVLAGLGDVGQRRLAAAHVALIGAGGLGSPAILALAAAGVGRLTVIDADTVDRSNLQRQVIHRTEDVGHRKVDSAIRAAHDLSPESRVDPVTEWLDDDNAQRILADADVVLDGSDTFGTRAAVARACERLGTPLVWGTLQEFSAQLTVFWSRPPEGRTPVVLSDLYPADRAGEPPSCAQVGVLGALCMQVGAAMAMQAIQLIAGIGEPLLGRLLLIDALGSRQREVPLVGGDGASPPPAREHEPTVRAADLAERLRGDAPPVVVDVREDEELRADPPIPGAVHLPLGAVLDDPADAVARVGRGPVAVVCQSGARSRRAAATLRAAGADAMSVAGGMTAWHGVAHEWEEVAG